MRYPFKTGVIGVGSMGKNHARVYSEMGVLGAITDVDFDTAGKLADRFGVEAYSDYKELLGSDIDAVNVATPTQTHYAIAMEAVKAGKHVLVEKPICSTIEESEELVTAAKDNGLVLAVGLIERHNPVVRFAKEAIEKGKFGDVVSISAKRVSSMPGRIRDVGVIMDLGIHDIDVMKYLADSPVKSVYALGGIRSGAEFEDHATVLLNFENGITGYVEVNWLTPMKVRRLALTCMENYVELDYIKQSADISSSQLPATYDAADLYHLPIEFDTRHVSLKKQEPLRNELEDFLDSIANKREPLVSGTDALETVRVSQAAIRSMKSGEIIMMGDA